MNRNFKDLTIIALSAILITFLVWLPHLLSLQDFWGLSFKEGFATIYRNYDGLEYITIAKTFYNPNFISALGQNLPAEYFASHFPGYPILILLFAQFLGFLKSMVFTTLFSTILSAFVFYQLVKEFKLTSHPLFLSLVFLLLPARWLIVHSVGSSEPLFIFFVISTVYLFLKFDTTRKYSLLILTALSGSAAQLTRPPGILLFISLCLYIIWKLINHKVSSTKAFITYLPLILIPLSLIGLFYWFSISYQDFFAYFHSGDNIHLTFPPFQVFNKNQYWVGDIWLEDIVYIFILGFLAASLLWKKNLHLLSLFVLTYLTASIFVAHRDISRYILPIFPFALIAFEKVLTSKEFKIILPLIALAVYLYTQNFILQNSAPIPNLSVFN